MAGSSGSGPGGLPTALGARLLRARAFVRAPIWLFRARLGFVFGGRALLLEHIGRKSGARRYVVLEIVSRPEPGVYVVASGFGPRAQWFRNLRANPHARVTVGARGPVPVRARVLEQAEADAVLAEYAARHPRAWAGFVGVLERTLGEPVTLSNTRLPMVQLRAGDKER